MSLVGEAFGFWDPVENVSLMPWLCLTALLHCIVVLEKKQLLGSWVIILSIASFTLSMCGTFLVRSGILNSVHTFANDPERGVFILIFLFILILLALIIYFFFYKENETKIHNTYRYSKETLILVNNWFLMYFLSVVLIGTVYPIFLEVLTGEKISIGPPFFHKLIIPFLIIFLIFMSIVPSLKWINSQVKIKFMNIIFFIFSIILSFFILGISSNVVLINSYFACCGFVFIFYNYKRIF